jgi:hypothetical protein
MKKILCLLIAGISFYNGSFSQTLQTVTDNGSTTTNSISVSPVIPATTSATFVPALTISPDYQRSGPATAVLNFSTVDGVIGTYTNIAVSGGSGSGLIVTVNVVASGLSATITVTSGGTGYLAGDVVTIPRSSLGSPTAGNYSMTIGNVSSSNAFNINQAPLNLYNYTQGSGYTGAFTPMWNARSRTRNGTIEGTAISFGYYWTSAQNATWAFALNGTYSMGFNAGGANIPTLNSTTVNTTGVTTNTLVASATTSSSITSNFITNSNGYILSTGSASYNSIADKTIKYRGNTFDVGNSFLSSMSVLAGSASGVSLTTGGSGYTPGSYTLNATGGSGTGLILLLTVSAGGIVNAVFIASNTTAPGSGYVTGDVISATIPGGGSGFTATLTIRSGENFAALYNASTFRSSTTDNFYTVRSMPVINNVSSYTGTVYGFYHNPTLTNLAGKHIAFQNVTGDVYMGTTSGKVGIGTTSPTQLLSVKGTVLALRVKVSQLSNTTDWPDYVFSPSYQLTPLNQVETYIQKNKHLPDVPSAAVIKKDGLDLGDNQAVLLKKIEELTLYIIDQNKKLEAQNERIRKLEEGKIN